MMDLMSIQRALLSLKTRILQADKQFDDWAMTDNEYAEPSWIIESCFLQLLAIAEALELKDFRQMVQTVYSEVKCAKNGFSTSESTPDGEPYSTVLSSIRRFARVLDGFFPEEPTTTVTKDVLQILRDIHYVITDKKIFKTSPANENDVHIRIEAILKCVFPDLKHKPILTKQIKNFVPDTGIPSLETLIEYKFLSRKEDIGPIADQLLADTRGYISKDWSCFIYVIYETNRFRTEKDWNQLLLESGVPKNTIAVVLGGEPFKEATAPLRRERRKK
jgi:hypothetical protein